MLQTRHLIENAVFDPTTLDVMASTVDQVWANIEHQYDGRRTAEVELARLALAKAVIYFAGLGVRDANVLKGMALGVMKVPSDS